MCGQLSSEITEKLKNAMALSLHSTKKKKSYKFRNTDSYNYSFHPPDQITASSGKGDIQWQVSGVINKEGRDDSDPGRWTVNNTGKRLSHQIMLAAAWVRRSSPTYMNRSALIQ